MGISQKIAVKVISFCHEKSSILIGCLSSSTQDEAMQEVTYNLQGERLFDSMEFNSASDQFSDNFTEVVQELCRTFSLREHIMHIYYLYF